MAGARGTDYALQGTGVRACVCVCVCAWSAGSKRACAP